MNGKKGPATLVELMADLHSNNIPPSHYKIYIDRFLEFKAREKGIPLSGVFELTPLCNLDCKMCYVHLNKPKGDLVEVVTLERWKSLIYQAHKKGMIKVNLTGGECLAYPAFEELYRFIRSLGIEVSILTNGVFLEGRILKLFHELKPRKIQVTLYGSSEEAYERVTGFRVYGRVYKNILQASELDIPMQLTITPNRYMFEDAEALINVAKKTGLSFNINSRLIKPREETGRVREDITNEQYVELYNMLNNSLVDSQLEGSLLENSEEDFLGDEDTFEIVRVDKEELGIPCGAGKSSFTIRWDGRMYPCVGIDDLSESILDQDFETAWNKIHKSALVYKVPAECSFCEFKHVCLSCVAMHKEASEKGHCDKQICNRTKLLLRAGLIKKEKKNHEKRV